MADIDDVTVGSVARAAEAVAYYNAPADGLPRLGINVSNWPDIVRAAIATLLELGWRPPASTHPPTKRQQDLLDFLARWYEHHDYGPSYVEMRDGIGLHSKSGISRLVDGLVSRGLVTHRPYCARSVRAVNGPPETEKPS